MIPADREALSELLATIEANDADTIGPTSTLALAKARAIVDQPAGIITINGSLANTAEIHRALRKAFAETGTDGKYTILNEPLHEYRDHIPTRHRHRAPNPWWLVVAFTLAGILAIALTASTTTPSGTERPNPQTRPAKPAPEAAQTRFLPGDAPWNVGHAPGSPGNGLGVVTP